MRRYGILLTLVAAVGLVMAAQGNGQGGSKAELKKIQGTWNVVSYEANGEKAPEEVTKKMKLMVKGNKWTLDRGEATNEGTIKLDPSKKPKEFEAMLDSGEQVLGLYEIKGDTLKMCWTGPGSERPKKFDGAEDRTLAVYKKAKSE